MGGRQTIQPKVYMAKVSKLQTCILSQNHIHLFVMSEDYLIHDVLDNLFLCFPSLKSLLKIHLPARTHRIKTRIKSEIYTWHWTSSEHTDHILLWLKVIWDSENISLALNLEAIKTQKRILDAVLGQIMLCTKALKSIINYTIK